MILIVVRQEVSNVDSSVVVHELELAINRAIYGSLCLWSPFMVEKTSASNGNRTRDSLINRPPLKDTFFSLYEKGGLHNHPQ